MKMKSSRPLLVGEQNPYRSDPRYALYPEPVTSAGSRLCRRVMGLTVEEYIRSYDRVNLCDGEWRAKEARERAVKLQDSYSLIVALGRNVQRAFGIDRPPFSVWNSWESEGTVFLVLPHPSGLNRLWDDPGSYKKARDLLREHGCEVGA